MLLTTRNALPLLAFVSAVAASASDTTPVPGMSALFSRAQDMEMEDGVVIARRGLGDVISCIFGSCNTINTNTDAKNCGAVGKVCPTSYANGVGSAFCSGGVCQSYCSSGYAFSTASAGCINTQYDPANCGGVGIACSYANGAGVCNAGSCSLGGCNTGYKLVGSSCTAINTANDASNCGSYGNVCTAGSGVATASCVSSKCVVATCQTGYSLSNGACSAINTQTSTSNCGAIGRTCPSSYSNGVGSICSGGVCQPSSCNTGFAFDTSSSSCRSVTSDASNCGAIGKTCSITSGTGTCVNSACSYTCNSGYKLVNGACTKTTASQRARVKKSKIPGKVQLCPGTETACPITGSASFLVAQSSGFSAFRLPDMASMVAEGGYECLDTQYAIESCGGCASMGEGKNCLAIPRAAGVGCNSGSCVVFSCEEGYKPNFDSTGCIKTIPTRHARKGHARRGHGIAGHMHAHASS